MILTGCARHRTERVRRARECAARPHFIQHRRHNKEGVSFRPYIADCVVSPGDAATERRCHRHLRSSRPEFAADVSLDGDGHDAGAYCAARRWPHLSRPRRARAPNGCDSSGPPDCLLHPRRQDEVLLLSFCMVTYPPRVAILTSNVLTGITTMYSYSFFFVSL